jgi:hypothetical protein
MESLDNYNSIGRNPQFPKMNGNRKRSLLRISLHGDRRKPSGFGYRPFAFLKASRHYSNDETPGNEMLRLLHSSLQNCCKSANKAFGEPCEARIPTHEELAFHASSRMAATARAPGTDRLIALQQPRLAAYAIAMAPCAKRSPKTARQ